MAGDCDITKKDLYKILECLPNSSTEQIKQAYHRKILETHPDKNKNLSMNIQMYHDVKYAWGILSDPHLRKEYDLQCKQFDLETKGELIYAILTPSDLEQTENEGIFSYMCRCGNSYLVQKSDLEQANCVVQIPCQDCTFVIAIET